MPLHFAPEEFAARLARTRAAMAERQLDGMLLFAQESMYWLSGYDSFGYCFFQCLVLTAGGRMALLTRAPDLRQARHTSNLADICVWTDSGSAHPADQLRDLAAELGLKGATLGIEYETHGLTAANGRAVDAAFAGFATLIDASTLIGGLRTVKSPAEITFVRRAGELADAALAAGTAEVRAGADEADILAAMQGSILKAGGDYPGNEFIIGSGPDALLCRYKTGRRKLDAEDQITLEFAGVWRHYHAALMRTIVTGRPTARHVALHAAAIEALAAVEAAMRPGRTFGDVFEAHAGVFDRHGLRAHRLNACGYSLGARFSPSWMEWPMFYAGNDAAIVPGMTLFAHMILMDSDSGTAMCLGRTYLTTADAPEPLSSAGVDLVAR
ncbi:MAG: aminopeptidase P family protein [Rhizobiales bacterium]|nr:aminopeptidase P family protein [Hyphomicrobiales bacterium]MBN9009390.1 aminopeptidase P family protein [Hyphomicrobiales bacterium]